MTEPRVALATAAALPDLDEDGPALLAALASRGILGEPAVWDDPLVDWSAYNLVIVRSTWDYAPRRDEFLRWSEGVSTTTLLANDAAVLRWNTDKRYLRELEVAGVPIVPTTWIEPGDKIQLTDAGECVVKPVISAGAVDTARYEAHQAARPHVESLLAAGRAVMVQPYVDSVDARGETALLYIRGDYSHAISKGARLEAGAPMVGGPFADAAIARRQPTAAERAVANAALQAVPAALEDLLYARIDVVQDAEGSPMILEVELAEPSLFLSYDGGATARFANAITAIFTER